jgi:hypothetical protein
LLSDQPLEDKIEISLLRPKRAYGESIVVHIGGGDWIVVDSCRQSNKDKPAPLAYLNSIGVDVASSVRLIVASHWHNDHIEGLAALFDACRQSQFVCSSALKVDELLLLSSAYKKHPPGVNRHGLEEITSIVSTLLERSPDERFRHLLSPKWAISQRPILSQLTPSGIKRIITPLSPSDASVLKAQLDIAELADAHLRNSKRSIISRNPNHNAIVLWVTIGEHHFVLGSDLENTKDPTTGWNIVLSDFDPDVPKANIYKVSHHGSITGDHPGIWEVLLSPNPIAILTPFFHGGQTLPTTMDVKRIKTKTNACYITAKPDVKHRKFSGAVKQMVHNSTKYIASYDHSIGHIRLRKKICIEPGPGNWDVITDRISRRL